MLRFGEAAIGVQHGSEQLVNDFEDSGPMWTGEGPRAQRVAVRFATPFEAAPVIHVGLTMWDIAGDSNQRIDIAATEIGPAGFVILLKTWGDTRIARLRADWLAIGATRHLDEFDPD